MFAQSDPRIPVLSNHSVTLAKARQRLPELLNTMAPGEILHITNQAHTIATLVNQPPPAAVPRQPGSAIGKLLIVSDDDEHLEHFREYMP